MSSLDLEEVAETGQRGGTPGGCVRGPWCTVLSQLASAGERGLLSPGWTQEVQILVLIFLLFHWSLKLSPGLVTVPHSQPIRVSSPATRPGSLCPVPQLTHGLPSSRKRAKEKEPIPGKAVRIYTPFLRVMVNLVGHSIPMDLSASPWARMGQRGGRGISSLGSRNSSRCSA